MDNKRTCCFMSDDQVGCEKLAEWSIIHGASPDDYTETCTEHLGAMMTDAPEHKVYPI